MTTDDWARPSDQEQDANVRAWPVGLMWMALAGTSWLLFELTANSALVAVVACFKFGWSDLCTAFWLRRADPLKARGRTCSWFYLAMACWKISVTAFALTMGIILIIGSLRLRFFPTAEVLAALLTFSASCGLAIVLTWFGSALAWKRGVKVWVDSSVSWFRKARRWPPEPRGRNKLHPLLFSASGVTGIVSLFAGLILGEILTRQLRLPIGSLAFGGILAFVLLIWALNSLAESLNKTIVATTPAECWRPEESPHPKESRFDDF